MNDLKTLITTRDKILLRQRALIEAVYNPLKHYHHGSMFNFWVNLLIGLIAYPYLAMFFRELATLCYAIL